MDELRTIRHDLSSGKVADMIDEILNDNRYGKGTIRDKIGDLLEMRKKYEKLPEETESMKLLAADIRVLNAALDRLHRRVYD
jgi:hypothetical protein